MYIAHRHGDRVGILTRPWYCPWGPQGCESRARWGAEYDTECQQANILIDSDHCARLADFGLAVIVDESATGSIVENGGMRGTLRWMAPELMYPEEFGFTGECQVRLPSRGTDVYALGMTILEVRTPYPFLYTAKLRDRLYRLSRGAAHFIILRWKQPLCARFSEEADQRDRLQVLQTNYGNC